MHYFHQGIRSSILVLTIVLLLLIFCNTPASAADISLAISGDINNWKLTMGQDNSNEDLSLTVVANSQPWYIKVRDALDDSKPGSSVGRMTEWNGLSYVTSPHVLSNAVSIAAHSGTGYTAGSAISLSGSYQQIASGTTTPSVIIPIIITQPVTIADINLTAGHVYRIVPTFSGGFT